jgi:hypothetical protein
MRSRYFDCRVMHVEILGGQRSQLREPGDNPRWMWKSFIGTTRYLSVVLRADRQLVVTRVGVKPHIVPTPAPGA